MSSNPQIHAMQIFDLKVCYYFHFCSNTSLSGAFFYSECRSSWAYFLTQIQFSHLIFESFWKHRSMLLSPPRIPMNFHCTLKILQHTHLHFLQRKSFLLGHLELTYPSFFTPLWKCFPGGIIALLCWGAFYTILQVRRDSPDEICRTLWDYWGSNALRVDRIWHHARCPPNWQIRREAFWQLRSFSSWWRSDWFHYYEDRHKAFAIILCINKFIKG